MVESAARSPLDVGDVDRPERRPASVSVHRRSGRDGRIGFSGAGRSPRRRWSWGSAARSSGISMTPTMRSRRRFWFWCARPVRSRCASRSPPGSTAWPIARPSGHGLPPRDIARGNAEQVEAARSFAGGRLPSRSPALASRRARAPSRQVPGADRALPPRRQDARRGGATPRTGRSAPSAAGCRAAGSLLKSRLERAGLGGSLGDLLGFEPEPDPADSDFAGRVHAHSRVRFAAAQSVSASVLSLTQEY